jgi:hypothetical protein
MRYINLEEIAKLVSRDRGMTIDDIRLKTRSTLVRETRQICHFLMEKWALASLEKIAHYTNLKNHSIILHSCKVIHNEKDFDEEINSTITNVESEINKLGFTLPASRKLRLKNRKVKTIPNVKYALSRATMQQLLNEIQKRYEAK